MDCKKIFLKHLTAFEETLVSFGYSNAEKEDNLSSACKESLFTHYFNKLLNLELLICYFLYPNNQISLSLGMVNKNQKGTFFSLDDFLSDHKLEEKIRSTFSADSTFDVGAGNYFSTLKKMFENELNDQITGKSFENHQARIDKSWDEHRNVAYKMEQKEIDDFLKKNPQRKPK